jgi:steroid delta-isomerase-like uncharacterized protein
MVTEADRTLIRRWWEAMNHGNALVLIDQFYAADYELHDPNVPEPVHGREGVRAFLTEVGAAFPDAQFSLDDLISDGDRVVQRVTFRGTHQGPFLGIAATGKAVSMWVIVISRIADGQIAEEWQLGDVLGLLQQLGASPTSAHAG